MKKYLSSVLAAVSSVCVFTLTAKAEWAKSYDWDDTKDQTWTSYDNSGKHYVSAGGWEIEYSTGVGDDIRLTYVKTTGTSSLLNFDTIERDTGLRLVSITASFKDKTILDNVVFPNSLTNFGANAFNNTRISGHLFFPATEPVTIGNSAFYGVKITSVTLTAPGSKLLSGSAFGGVSTWSGESDFTGVIDFGDSAFNGAGSSVATILVSPMATNFGGNCFYQAKSLTIKPKYTLAQLNAVQDVPCTIGKTAFKDFGSLLNSGFTLEIPFKGPCTVGSQAFNWMLNCTNFHFWGKAPVFAGDAFNSIGAKNGSTQLSYHKSITGCLALDETGWRALATPCTDEEKALSTYPGDDVCFGTYTGNSGCVFWMCDGESPYTADTSNPVIEEVAVSRTADGFRVIGSLVQGKGVLTVSFGNIVIPLLGGVSQTAPYALDVTIPVGGEGGAPTDWIGVVQVKATDGDKVSSVELQDPFYTGTVSIACEKNASEARLSPGVFVVSRSATATSAPLTVYYAVSGSAIAGKNFVALSGEVTIPEGESSATVVVRPLLDTQTSEATELCLTLQNRANYLCDASQGSVTMTIANTDDDGWDIYVDSAASAGGDGSEEAPLNSIVDGVAAALPNRMVYVKGGAGREYVISSDENRLEVTSDKSGLTICNWGDERPLVSITNKFNKTALTSFPIHVKAAGVTIKGIRFTYSYDSLTELSYGGVSYAMIRFVLQGAMEDCEVVRGPWSNSATDNRYCTGQGGLIQNESPFELRNCSFVSVRSDNLSYQHPVVRMCTSSQARPATFVGCYFTNCTWAVESQSGCQDVVCISNVFVNCESGFAAASDSGNQSDGLFRGAANGIGHLTLAYNVIYNDETMAGKSKTVLQGCRETYNGGILAHHNTIVGWDNFLSRSNIYGNNLTDTQVFDNIFVMNDGGNVYNEAWKYNGGKDQSNVPTSFKSGSFFKNNYVNCTINGGTLKDYSGYDFASNTTVENNITEGAPVFESLDPASPKFCLMKQSKNPMLVGKNIAWTNDGAYPSYIGAIEPVKEQGFIFILR